MYSELTYQLSLCDIPYIGNVHAKKLIEVFGSASEVFNARLADLERIEHIGALKARSIKNFKDFGRAEKETVFIEKYGIQPLFISDSNYPKRLLNCFDPPSMLFYMGNANVNSLRIVAVVGTRNNTEYGKSFTEKLIKSLAAKDVLVVSGLAFGIDSIAHKSSLKFGIPTIGVVGHGLDTIYPKEHTALARQMITSGGLLSEFKSNTRPDKHNFPSRNRVVAGISDATVVIESGEKGGSNITANLAWEYNRDVFAVPGRTIDAKSIGCNKLIRENKAALLSDPEEFIELLGWNDAKKEKRILQKRLFNDFNPDEIGLLELLRKKELTGIDDLIFSSGMSSTAVAASLLKLEMSGIVKVLPGKRFKLED